MDSSSGGRSSTNSSFSIRYHANNEELEEVFQSEEDPPTPQADASSLTHSDASSKRERDKSASIIDKYFKSVRPDKSEEKPDKEKTEDKSASKDVNSSPMKDYLSRLKRKDNEKDVGVPADGKDGPNETWRILKDFKVKIVQAVEDIKSSRAPDEKERSVPRDSSVSDSDENSAARDVDQLSVGVDTDNQVSSLHSSIQNLSELTQAVTTKTTHPPDQTKTPSESSDDTQKNLQLDDAADEGLDVESGVEALEDDLADPEPRRSRSWTPSTKHSKYVDDAAAPNYLKDSLIPPPSVKSLMLSPPKKYFFTFSTIVFTVAVIWSYTLLPAMPMWNGILIGMWTFNFLMIMKEFLSDCIFGGSDAENYAYFHRKRAENKRIAFTIPPIKEHGPVKKFEGWINHYRYPEYDPNTYHINKTVTAFMKLEDCHLRISYTNTKVSKRAMWDEKIEKVAFFEHRLYNLAGARMILLPKGLVGKRFWSKKYPIVVILNETEKMQVLEKESVKEDSPEKSKKEEGVSETSTTEGGSRRRKLLLRRKDRDGILRPGLRQRIRSRIKRAGKKDDSTCDPELLDEADHKLAADGVDGGELRRRSEPELNEEELRDIYDIIDEAEALEGHERESTEAPAEWSVDSRQPRNTHLYIFPRTGRDKYEWYRRLRTAIKEAAEAADDSSSHHDSEENVFKLADDSIGFSKIQGNAYNVTPEPVAVSWTEETLRSMNMSAHERNFWPYMYKIIQQQCRASETATSSEAGKSLPADVAWLNAVIARVAYDAMRNPEIVLRVQRRIQRKLSSLKLPSVVESLIATELSLGSVTPVVEVVAGPACDERGVWLDAVLRYEGDAYITLNTNINLMKRTPLTFEEQMERLNRPLSEVELERHSPVEGTTPPSNPGSPGPNRAVPQSPVPCRSKNAIYDSEVDDSAESSSDEDSPNVVEPEDKVAPPEATARAGEGGSSAKKFLRIVEKITTSRYFQHVQDYKIVKRAMEGISNTDIKLHIDIKGLEGRLAINLPPPPHDRVWIGFRAAPHLWLKARPAVGTRAVRIAHITNWIEARLCKEFEKILVLPNMEDITVELLTPTPVEFE